ncbi:MAG: DEAD/DEAH box helicase family protein [Nostocales cyanobacterium LE14-WE4]|jgi:replicative superfamily II helicase|nr:DEAD/DEAH box helicase family protein [Anabaena sp. 49633_E8]MCE2701310.1 DEAD/DEAH box helicase family protein [Anabaena sp. 49633_E8]MDJ0500032.1 DEAD/DEAH box helicase family protein [Nostocales cyanobacterium LE14-WE4]
MVDFKKLRESKIQPTVIDPVAIYRRLPPIPGFNDIYTSQAEVLNDWFNRRNERDLVIKLHTGGGKTLVALLIAQSILNEHREPVIYLSPTLQLVEQTLAKAKEYNISAVAYGSRFSEDFLSGKSVLVCTYQSLFNGESRFGLRGGIKQVVTAAAIILDDAHVAFSNMRDIFTLSLERSKNQKNQEDYSELTSIFRSDFEKLGKLGSFDDLVSGKPGSGILEVPYWSWKAKSEQVREFLRHKADNYTFVWPFIRDNFNYCHCLISKDAFVITPIFPLVDMIPTFADCPRRIFLSATISDDTAIVRTFDADPVSISKPITSNSLAGVSERMILAPELMPFPAIDIPKIIKELVQEIAKKKMGTVILVPSKPAAQKWQDVATYSDSSEKVAVDVKQLQEGTSYGPFVFANRYDGIDLPGSACRLLILSELPRGSSEYDQYRANTFVGGSELTSTLAQRIEQGMGRGARGHGDYCVVILTGQDLTAWISRSASLKFLNKSTRAQFEIGIEISKNVVDKKALHDTIIQCLNRDKSWIEYHSETLAELTESLEEDKTFLDQASIERKVFKLMRDGYFEKAISKLEKYWQNGVEIDQKSRGWLKQLAARAAFFWEKTDLSQQLQQQAYEDNHNLLRPQVIPPYVPLTNPGKQAEAIINRITSNYKNNRRGYLAWFRQISFDLVPEASANRFEEALKDLGLILGFDAERPEKIYGNKAPDVLWLLDDKLGLVIEAKSRKYENNPLNKENYGQLLASVEWFKKEYPTHSCIPVSVHRNTDTTKSIVINDSRALTLNKLNQLITDLSLLLQELCESKVSDDQLVIRCEQFLDNSKFKPDSLIKEYLVAFAETES